MFSFQQSAVIPATNPVKWLDRKSTFSNQCLSPPRYITVTGIVQTAQYSICWSVARYVFVRIHWHCNLPFSKKDWNNVDVDRLPVKPLNVIARISNWKCKHGTRYNVCSIIFIITYILLQCFRNISFLMPIVLVQKKKKMNLICLKVIILRTRAR